MNTQLLQQASMLDVNEQIELVEAIWNGIVSRDAAPLLTDPQITELDRRLADHLANPDDVIGWDEVKADALAKIKRNPNMKFNKKLANKIQEQALRFQEEFGLLALTCPDIYNMAAEKIVLAKTPLQIGQMLHPGCRAAALADVPAPILDDHRQRYTEKDLREGQFIIVTGSKDHYVFIMGHETKKRKDKENSK